MLTKAQNQVRARRGRRGSALADGRPAEALLDELIARHRRQGTLSQDLVQEAADVSEVSPSHAFGVASFYSMLSFKGAGPAVRVCDGPACWLKGAGMIREALESAGTGWRVERSSCLGLCDRAPALLVDDQQAGPVTAADHARLQRGWRGSAVDYSQARPGEVRVMLAGTGKIDPDSIDSALEHGAYEGLQAALRLSPQQVLEQVTASGLQGRGGAGFPVGRKWGFVAQAARSPKYMVCNADESEPLLFKDRVLMETNPHQLLEGILIGGYACGASDAWIYIRGEYEMQRQRLERAIAQAEQKGYLGAAVLGTKFSFRIHLHRGAGAYICGEETALLESLEGNRGEPRLRPPYPPQSGFRGQPTAVNNVESFSAVPAVLRHGSKRWRGLSGFSTPGTKLFMVLGSVNTPVLFEAPFGITLRQIIEDFGGGLQAGSEFHFALCGGAAGTIVDRSLLDVPLDYASSQKGISLGGGAFLICDQRVSPVAFLAELMHFFAVESCGKCTPCRVGTWRALEILNQMRSGRAQQSDLQELSALSEHLSQASFCGLGQSAAIPLTSALHHFVADFTMAAQRRVEG